MKKLVFIPLLITTIGLSVFYKNITGFFLPEKPVNKELNLSIATAANYHSRAYENAQASVRVSIYKIRGKQKMLIWEKTFDTLQLKRYPDYRSPMVNSITIPNVVSNREKIIVVYTITYNTQGSILQMANGKVFPGKNNRDKLEILI